MLDPNDMERSLDVEAKNKKLSPNALKYMARSEKRNICEFSGLTQYEVRCLIKMTSQPDDITILLKTSLFTGRELRKILLESKGYLITALNSKFKGCGLFEVNREYPKDHLNKTEDFEESSSRISQNRGFVFVPAELAGALKNIFSKDWTEDEIVTIVENARSQLAELNKKYATRLTLVRIAGYFRNYCAHQQISEPTYGVIAGKDLEFHVGGYYTTYKNDQVLAVQQRFARHLCKVAETQAFLLPDVVADKCWGSLRVPTEQQVVDYCLQLSEQSYFSFKSQNLIATHNFYTAYSLAIMRLSTCHRPESHAFGSLERFSDDRKIIYISDKITGKNHLRCVPLTEIAMQQLEYYLQHLRLLQSNSRYLFSEIVEGIDQILAGEKNLLCYIKNEKFQFNDPLCGPPELEVVPSPGQSNWYRHFVRSYLEKNQTASDLMDWFMGHEARQDHSFGRFSALDLSDLKSTIDIINSMIANLGITPIASPLSLGTKL
jgi:hypothetical protein